MRIGSSPPRTASATDRTYAELPTLVHVTVDTLVQEANLEFEFKSRTAARLGDAEHLQIMRHNFSISQL